MKNRFLLLFVALCVAFCGAHAQTTGLWGVTSQGGEYNAGVIFKTDANGDNQTVAHAIYKVEGDGITNKVILGPKGLLYGLTQGGATTTRELFLNFRRHNLRVPQSVFRCR